ncbi:TPA: type I restriction endonuclease subunit R [Streptococcus suis]
MSGVGQVERKTQDRIVKLFSNTLDFTYLGNWHERENNAAIEEEYLRKYLVRKGYTPDLINRAMDKLVKAAGNQVDKLYYANKAVYSLIRYGAQVKEHMGENNQTVSFINFDDVYDNDFYIAEEVSIKGEHKKRPDIVIYVNGIALGVIELKRSTVSISEGIRQNLDNQSSNFIRPFFHTMQLIMAGNDTAGMRYGTIETKEKYYLTWKEDDKADDRLSLEVESITGSLDYVLDKQIVGMCHKERFLEIIHDFVVFDRGVKKLCRPNQYFGVRAASQKVKQREGGIIWHTQGSGKSLTMVWLAKWIRENISDSRILIITDRDELDKQIEKVFRGVDEDLYRTKSGADLIEKLNATTPLLLGSLIHKFGRKEGELKESDYDQYIADLKKSLPKDFKAKGDIYVFVDECHRTQSGKLHDAMKVILPNAVFIGFTGTPLLKKDKQKSIEVFGGYIHTYKFDEAVKDNVVLDLQYEARDVDQDITSQEKIDKWFEAKTRGLTDYAIVKLKQRWGTLQKVLSSKSRLVRIVNDIIYDMETKDRLQNGRGNAMLVAGSIYEACKYYELFQSEGFKKCAIVTSYSPNISDIKGESTGEDQETENIEKYEIYQKMLDGKNPEDFEEEVKKQFIDDPAQMKLLIVVDKLLTGFDAPPATYLYIDKSMQDHGLFQAICRVNRLHGDDKEYGYIVDYKDLFKSLEKSVGDYTSEAFDGYEKEDIEGLLTNRLDKAREKLDTALESLEALCEPVAPPKDTLAYIRYFVAKDTLDKEAVKENEQKRLALYKHLVAFIRAYAGLANEMEDAGYSKQEADEIIRLTKYYDNVRHEVMHAAGDYIDLKAYEGGMRHLIDSYISAKDSEKISAFDDMSLIDLIVEKGEDAVDSLPEGIKKDKEAVAETIENNVRKLIIDETPTNPKYYEKMSVLLDEIIKLRKEQVVNYQEYLAKIVELAKRAKDPGKSESYPKTINSGAKRALYDNLEQNESLVLAIDEDLTYNRPDGWRGSKIKERKVKYIVGRYVEDDEKLDEIFEIVKNQGEY